MKKTTLFQNFKQWLLKSTVSSVIFVSVVILGGTIITLALPSTLDDVKSTNTDNQLTADSWDFLVDQVKALSGKISNISGNRQKHSYGLYSTGRVGIGDVPSSTATTTLSVRGNSYLDGNLGIGTAPNNSYKLYVNGTGFLNGNVGIGTAPENAYKLKVSGNSLLAGNSHLSGNVGIGGIPNNSYKLYVNGTGYINGNVGIGTTPNASDKLRVDGALRIWN
jgi:hypothetical protein